MADRGRLQRALGHEFGDPELLALALTHRSVGRRNNERLEFLGDSIVNHVVAEAIFQRFPRAREGDMSRMRAALVNKESLAELARELELGEYVLLGPSERKSGGHRRSSILADAVEALAGAILLDAGIERCRQCVLAWFDARLDRMMVEGADKDPKTRLQEFLQGRGHPLPQYELLDVVGEEHRAQFRVACRLQDPDLVVEGAGSSRRKAEQSAARSALERLNQRGN
jgi:ribonuclease-3